MTEKEINSFIEKFEEVGDKWTPENVKDVYGDYTYEEAVTHRKAIIDQFGSIMDTVINR